MKSKDAMALHAFLALAHNGAFLAIDAIDPDGSQNEAVYRVIGEVFSEIEPFEKEPGGRLCADAAIYFSLTSKYYSQDSRKHIRDTAEISDTSTDLAYLDAPVGAARALKEAHIPFAVISRPNINSLERYQVVIVSNAMQMDAAEVDAFRQFVEAGGSLYLSGAVSPRLLKDVFGIQLIGETKENVTYISPVGEGCSLLPDVQPKYPLTIFSPQLLATGCSENEILARIVLPGTDPADPDRFSSIHSNPPLTETEYPSIVSKAYGKGRMVWSSASFEAETQWAHRKAFTQLIKAQFNRPVALETNAHPSVEITLFEQPERFRYLLNLVNAQETLPAISLRGIDIGVRLAGQTPLRVIRISDGVEVPFRMEDGKVCIRIDLPGLFEMIAIESII